MTKLWGQFALQAGAGISIHPVKNFFFNADVGVLASMYPLPISFWSEGAGIWSGGNLLVEPVVFKLGLGVGF